MAWITKVLAKELGIFIEIDPTTKTWKVYSKPAFNPGEQVRDYSDILAIFKSNIDEFHTTEERDGLGRLKKFTVETN